MFLFLCFDLCDILDFVLIHLLVLILFVLFLILLRLYYEQVCSVQWEPSQDGLCPPACVVDEILELNVVVWVS